MSTIGIPRRRYDLRLERGEPTPERVSSEQIAAQIGIDRLDPSVAQFHRLWYEASYTWPMVRYKGVPLLKCPMDLQVYHEILWQLRPSLVIETGTCFGGSALWFADQLAEWDGRVISIDLNDKRCPDTIVNPENRWPEVSHPRVHWIVGDCLAPETIAQVKTSVDQTDGPVFVSLDSDHHAAHVQSELYAYTPFVSVGSYCVVEDTNISGRPIVADDPGPGAAVEAWLPDHPEFMRNALCERFLLTFSPEGWLYRAR